MTYSRGYIRDPLHKRTQKPALALLGAPIGDVPPSASLEDFEAPIFDQGMTSSCLGHGTAQGIYTAFAAHGDKMPWVPSPAGIYTVARCVGRRLAAVKQSVFPPATLPPLTDSGAMPADAMRAISLWGVRPMGQLAPTRFSDQLVTEVNLEPKLGALMDDAETLLVGEYRIDETAPDMIGQVCAAIVHGYPVGIGIFVDTTFEQWTKDRPIIGVPNMMDQNGGGHWMVLTSYKTLPDGTRAFRGPNSWGPQWGDAGHFVASEAWLRSAWDLYVLNVSRTK